MRDRLLDLFVRVMMWTDRIFTPGLVQHNEDVIMLRRLGEPREAWPQHLGTCRRCNNTYLLGTSCGDADHLLKETHHGQ